MYLEDLREYCLSKKGVEEGLPFGEDILVFKVLNKIFALTSIASGDRVNLKCDPDYALELREQFMEIQPGFHMNKKHWNTVILNGSLDERLVLKLVDHSYELVAKSLPKKDQILLASL